ncbi:MAG: CBS domain-containing protein, partial [Methanobacterium sp.]|nr:CBS domain-containing protein [Methanobacterium sp.]
YKPARIRNLLVEDVMIQNVKTVPKESSISDTAIIMLDEKFSGLPVMADNQMTGIITKTDFLKLIVELEKV